MSLAPDPSEQIARARGDLRMGVPIVIIDGPIGILVQAAETLTPERAADARALPGDTVLSITARRAETLKARAYDGDLARIHVPEGADLRWIIALADPADDLRTPMKGPLRSVRDGKAGAHRIALRLAKDARLLPSVLITDLDNPSDFATKHDLTTLFTVQVEPLLGVSAHYHDIVHARLPMEVSDKGQLHVFRPDNGGEEHYAIIVGTPNRNQPVLTRLHSACFTGDLMGSLKCDCGPQLRAALAQMGAEGAGILLYLNQEGRGIGLANKMRAYSLQDQGFDTVEANHRLGFEDDERDFRIGAALLSKLGVGQVRLLTNNPAKIEMMQKTGITVSERVALKVGENHFNADYLRTKATKSGHLL
ncbi:MAG: GTP cyclohydrolase II [Planktotalea sp.]|jgi:GTP cyclohydrolase II|uniref:GTP cyclohydrolase II n=1 Tax=Planktotalea sp. TaxID=2029877 RepID=UPI0026324168|nr:GTP cyclohydrolase II [Planktotalea sp.]MDG1075784.1 GTP cyclohydrolase II [Planktotalea sp.]MDG1084127.1 GTP cyclohydrolase II [Planktotalea sp.]